MEEVYVISSKVCCRWIERYFIETRECKKKYTLLLKIDI
jgi:hypothetical protein